jgi:DNA polymerase elongation subunit (family B)
MLKDIYKPKVKDKICILHYACSDFSKIPIKISVITLLEFKTKKFYTFSILESNEKEMLEEFYEYIRTHNDNVFVGWNLKNDTYGLQVIERRYKQVTGSEVPIRLEHVFDLDSIFQKKYGSCYVSHGIFGKMYSLFALNGVNLEYFIEGKREAELFDKEEIRKIEMSNICKVQGINNVLELSFANKLKIENGLKYKVQYFIDNSLSIKIIMIVAALLGVILTVYSLM